MYQGLICVVRERPEFCGTVHTNSVVRSKFNLSASDEESGHVIAKDSAISGYLRSRTRVCAFSLPQIVVLTRIHPNPTMRDTQVQKEDNSACHVIGMIQYVFYQHMIQTSQSCHRGNSVQTSMTESNTSCLASNSVHQSTTHNRTPHATLKNQYIGSQQKPGQHQCNLLW